MPGIPPSHPDPLGDLSRRGLRDPPLRWLPSSASSHLRSAFTSVRSGLLRAVLDEKGLPPAGHPGHPVRRAAVPLGKFKVAQIEQVGKQLGYLSCALFTNRPCLSCVKHVKLRHTSVIQIQPPLVHGGLPQRGRGRHPTPGPVRRASAAGRLRRTPRVASL